MAFKRKTEKKAAPTIEVPSLYGSHSSMIEAGTTAEDGWAVLRDEKGLYCTEVSRLDSGLADPKRYNSSRVAEDDTLRAKVVK